MTSPVDGTRAPGRSKALSSSLAVSVVGPLPAMLVGALAPQIGRDLRFSNDELGLALALYFAASATISSRVGKKLEQVGWRVGIQVGLLGSAIWLLAMALAARSWTVLALCLVAAGVTNAVAHPAANQSLASEMPASRLGTLFGIKQAAIPLSSLIAGLSLPLLAVAFGWRTTLIVIAFSILALWTLMRVRAEAQPAVAPEADKDGTVGKSPTHLKVLAVGVALATAATYASGSFYVISAVALGTSESRAGFYLALGGVVSIGIRMAAGRLSDVRSWHGILPVVTLLTLGGLALALMAITDVNWLLGSTVVLYASLWGWTGLFNAAVVRSNMERPAASTSVTQVGVYVGAGAGPLLFGLVAERASYTLAWASLVPLAWIGAVLMVIAKNWEDGSDE